MLKLNSLVCVTSVLLVQLLFPGVHSLTKACEFDTADHVDVSPETQLNYDGVSDTNKAEILPIVQLIGVCDFNDTVEKYGVEIKVEIPYYNITAESPADEIGPDSDDYEHVQLYFANVDEACFNSTTPSQHPCYRILEVRFNRFDQYRLRLRHKPHNLLTDKDLPPPVFQLNVTDPPVAGTSWTATFQFDSDLLPKNFTRIGVFVVDSTQPKGYERYHSTYRMYNHVLSLLDLQVVSNYKELKEDELGNIILPDENDEYSQYWEGI